MALRLATRSVFAGSVRRLYSQATATAAATSAAESTAESAAEAPASTGTPSAPTSSQPEPQTKPTSRNHAAITSRHLDYMVPTYSRPPIVFKKGYGSWMTDVEGRRYLDFTAGIAVNALGHSPPTLAKIIHKQALKLMHASNLYFNEWTGQLCELLVEKTRAMGGMHDASSVFVCNSGSEANEAAIKFSRKVGKVLDPTGAKHEIVSFHGSFHGRTMGSLSATPNPKYQDPFSPMVPGFRYGKYNDVAAVHDLVTEQTCGVLVEPIQGEGGVNVATNEFLTALAKRCREVGAVLIYDEIQCGLMRTGMLWAHSKLPKEAHPDIITSAKALGNGFPIGATITNRFVSDKIKIGDHGTTYGGNPLACRAAHWVVEQLTDPDLQKQVIQKGNSLKGALGRLHRKFPDLISEVRGRGLILGLQLTQDPSPIVDLARNEGLLIITCGTNTLRFVPPLNIGAQELRKGITRLTRAINIFLGNDPMHTLKSNGTQEGAHEEPQN
ncbi:acetylornithine and succinylornithine aminotransferase [Nemania sp. FL0916]|nr:acetylornithine and succinylornithine aminotransferase [Nemania sp. FL0916]